MEAMKRQQNCWVTEQRLFAWDSIKIRGFLGGDTHSRSSDDFELDLFLAEIAPEENVWSRSCKIFDLA